MFTLLRMLGRGPHSDERTGIPAWTGTHTQGGWGEPAEHRAAIPTAEERSPRSQL